MVNCYCTAYKYTGMSMLNELGNNNINVLDAQVCVA